MVAAAVTALVAASACSMPSTSSDVRPEVTGAGAVFPGSGWEQADPTDAGFEPVVLSTLVSEAKAASSSCLAVVRDGKVVVDEHGPGPDMNPREAFSVTKSLTGLLVGVAVRRAELSLSDRVADYIPQWRETPSAGVTVEHLLTNTSGREWDAAIDYGEMAVRAADKSAFAIGLGQEAEPGTEWVYNNSAVQVLAKVLQTATGVHPSDYAEEHIFGPLGMDASRLGRDPSGGAMTFMGLKTTCLDLARLGVFMLHNGNWKGMQIVDADYIRASVTPSTNHNRGYGRLWWVNAEGVVASPALAVTGRGDQQIRMGPLVPSAPRDTFWALGFNNQILAVVPEQNVVAVRLGPKPPPAAPFGFQQLTISVLEAIR
ncbi:serine hydrolase domain-containing protein [Nocardia asiatica]|uniref:serine hydrolase domain-containing protein n=1 Tax=Nocardia asiatica TaxID=209252 RepID=UPI0012FA360B|nr:serine hydrolase [Nocardia asiatica]